MENDKKQKKTLTSLNKITKIADRLGISKRRLAADIGISDSYFRSIRMGRVPLTDQVISRIDSALEIYEDMNSAKE